MSQIKTILCIEDDLFIGEMYRRSLLKAGYAVDLVNSGSAGLQAATQKQYDLILLDIMLPEQKGTEVLQKLRGDDKDLIPNSKILVLTNFDQDDESRLAMQSKADGYLIKADITPRRLIEIIRSLDNPQPISN